MKIVVLLTAAFDVIGGIHTFNRALIRAFDDLSEDYRFDIEVLSILDAPPSEEMRRQYSPSGHVSYRGFHGSRIGFGLAALRAARTADWVVFGHANLVPLAPLFREARKSLVIHGVDVWRKVSFVKRVGLLHVDEVLSVSRYTEASMVAHNGLPPVQVELFPNTLDPLYPVSVAGSRRPSLPQGRRILTVTRLDRAERSKNIALVIKSLPQVLRAVPDAYYVIVGDGAARKSLERMARSAGVADRVLFAGAVTAADLPFYYESCDVFALPSVKEGFGIVFLEAMYYGKACVGANAGGIPEVIVDGETGLIPDPASPSEIGASLVWLLQHREERERMGQNGRERLARLFSFEAFRGRLDAIVRAHGCARVPRLQKALAPSAGASH